MLFRAQLLAHDPLVDQRIPELGQEDGVELENDPVAGSDPNEEVLGELVDGVVTVEERDRRQCEEDLEQKLRQLQELL